MGPAEAALAEQVLASLDRAYWRVGDVLGTYPPRTPSAARAAGGFDGTIRVPMRDALRSLHRIQRTLADFQAGN